MAKELRLLNGDCLDKLKELENNSIDSIVTDPPYGLSFMGKKWDYDVPSVEIWQECLRVLKPGGHLLAFAGSRTYHRMAVRIEDAGFDIRDQIMWIYGSGFPKSHNIGKSIDNMQGNQRQVVGKGTGGKTAKGFNLSDEQRNAGTGILPTEYDYTKGNSIGEGWGTALKPAHEPIVMARKPISEKTIAENVLKWGTGAINIDESRIKHNEPIKVMKAQEGGNKVFGQGGRYEETTELKEEGRWPANVILDEEAGQILDEQSGNKKSAKRGSKYNKPTEHTNTYTPVASDYRDDNTYDDEGGASRFFYCPKASKRDRDHGLDKFEEKGKGWSNYLPPTTNGTSDKIHDRTTTMKNIHPTVKPTELMKYLIRLVTPKAGIVLDPFMGSGSTGKAAMQEGMWFVGIEREKEYYEIAKQRIEYEMDKRKFW